MTENIENVVNAEPSTHDRLAEVVVKDRPKGGVYSQDAINTIARLGGDVLLASQFRNSKDPDDAATKTALGIIEVLSQLDQGPLINKISELAKEKGIK